MSCEVRANVGSMGAPIEDDSAAEARPPVPRRSVGGGLLDNVIGPLGRAGRYYAQSWRSYLNQRPDELPIARPSAALAAHALRDEIVLLGLRMRRPLSDVQGFQRITGEVVAALDFYRRRGWLNNPGGYFKKPPAGVEVAVSQLKGRAENHQRLVFESGYAPNRGEPGRERWLGYTANNRVYAVMLRHPEPRPWLVCVHGAEMGRAGIDRTIFHARHLYADLGLNVVLPVLPMHGPRGRWLPDGAVFPGEDILDNVHATAQAVWDIRRLISWIRCEEPDSPIGLNAISLGGYVAALVASLEDDLACAILGVPVVNLVDVLVRHSGIGADDPRRETFVMAEPIGRLVSPLSLQPRVPLRGRFIYAGVADQLVHPRDQVVRLWRHWGRPQIVWYRGGHTGFFRSQPVQHFIDEALIQSGLARS